MSATFDTTTKAAYDAATTAQDRAEAIVASLTGTISVKVFNGSNTEMGSGTMAAPWATAVAGSVVLGEVSSFTVGTTATPDASWYIRFQNADVSRWARGSFGLSGADYNWSLATWESGQTGTIGTATIIASGGTGIEFTLAPTSASIPSSGGTIQFTAEPVLFYSLATTRPGITINPTTGQVTVTAVAAGTSGNIVVEATDGISTASATCLVTVASEILLEETFIDYDVGPVPSTGLYRGAVRYWRNHIDGDIDGSPIAGMMETSIAAVSATEREYQTRITKTVASLPSVTYPGIDSYRSELKGSYAELFDLFFDANGRAPEMFYGWRFRVTEMTFAGNLVTGYVFQFHNTEGGSGQDPIFALLLSGTKAAPKIQVYQEANIETGGNRYTDLINPLVVGQWYDIVIAARWCYRTNAAGGNGRLRVWVDSDPDGAPRFDWSGGNCHPPPSTNGRIPHIKFGQYHTLFEYAGQGTVGDTVRYSARQLRVNQLGLRSDVVPR
jgi:hypothetical protein